MLFKCDSILATKGRKHRFANGQYCSGFFLAAFIDKCSKLIVGRGFLAHIGVKDFPWIDVQCTKQWIKNFHRSVGFVCFNAGNCTLVNIDLALERYLPLPKSLQSIGTQSLNRMDKTNLFSF